MHLSLLKTFFISFSFSTSLFLRKIGQNIIEAEEQEACHHGGIDGIDLFVGEFAIELGSVDAA